jgi:hypothetical protein
MYRVHVVPDRVEQFVIVGSLHAIRASGRIAICCKHVDLLP